MTSATGIEIVTEPLGGSPLSRAIQEGRAPAPWVRPVPAGASAWADHAHSIQARFAGRGWLSSLAPAIEASGAAAERLRRVAGEGGVVVTTGQQPGLFGGPMYTIGKALSALAYADELERATGIACGAIFWAATDDADLAESQQVWVANGPAATELRGAARATPGTPAALVPQGPLADQLSVLRAACGSGGGGDVLKLVASAYGDPQTTIGAAYVRFLRELLEPLGVAVLDAAHPVIRHEGHDLLASTLAKTSAVQAALAARFEDIRRAGFTPQVDHVAGATPVFAYDARGTKARVPTESASQVAGNAPPGTLGPNVLLRPIVESMLLPTVAYVAGPGELAYFAQVSALADALTLPGPLALPRWSATVVEPHVQRSLVRLNVSREELEDLHRVEARLAKERMPSTMTDALRDLEARLASAMDAVEGADHTELLPAAVRAGARRRLSYEAARLQRRAHAAVKRREHEMMRQLAVARAALLPAGKRQERALTLVPTLVRHGRGVLVELLAAARAHAREQLGVAVLATASRDSA